MKNWFKKFEVEAEETLEDIVKPLASIPAKLNRYINVTKDKIESNNSVIRILSENNDARSTDISNATGVLNKVTSIAI